MEFPWMLFTGIWTFTLSLRGSLRSGVTKWTYVHEWPTYECLSRLTYVCTSTENQPSPVSPPSSLKQQPSPQRPELSTDGRSHTMSVDTVKEVRKKNPVISSPHLGFFFSVLQFLSSFWWLSSVIRYTGSSVKLTVTLKAVSPSVYLYKSLLFPQVSPLVWMKDYVPFVLWLLLCYKLSQLPWSVNRKGATMNSSLGLWQTSTLCAVQIIRKNFRNIFINIILLHWLPGLRNET